MGFEPMKFYKFNDLASHRFKPLNHSSFLSFFIFLFFYFSENNMYFNIVMIPLLNYLIISFLGRFLTNFYLQIFIIISMGYMSLLAVLIFNEIALSDIICTLELFNWIIVNDFSLSWNLYFDNITVVMLLIITIISFLVHIYSFEYMSYDPHLNRFISYLSIFTFFMLILVTSGNYLQLFLGWEGVGISSYLLINFWHTRINANKSALKAVFFNRIGDLSLFVAFSLIILKFKTLNYLELMLLITFVTNYESHDITIFNISLYDWISFFILIGVMGKSAQIGLHVWLPDAMEGPTPVSALIHAATMVTAGVFLILRSNYFFEFSLYCPPILATIGGLTAIFAASIGTMQTDIKRIIAYSTCSQLGYMVFACGFHNYNVAFFHLFNHAFFKALLFLTAGAIIHALNNEQDIRKMGGLFKILPFSYISFIIGSLALTGFPFLTGFYSKDFLLELTLTNFSNYNIFIYWLSCTAAFCTAFYSFRLIYFVFFIKTQNYKKNIEFIKENELNINISLFILIFCSIFIGFIFKDLIIGVGSNFWSNILIINPFTNNIYNAEFLTIKYKLIPLLVSFFGIICCFIIYNFFINKYIYNFIITSKNIKYIYFFFNKRWFFDLIYNFFITKFIYKVSLNVFIQKIDRGFLEILGPLGFIRLNYIFAKIYLNFYQKGYLKFYLKIYLIFIIIFYNSFFFNLFLNINQIFYFFEIFIYIFIILNIIKYYEKYSKNI